MAEQVLMIALSPTMETGTLVKWNKKEGDKVESGDVLCEVETDKAAMDYESIYEGTLLKILVNEGQAATVGDVIAIIGEEGEDISELLPDTTGDATSGDSSPIFEGGDSPTSDRPSDLPAAARPTTDLRIKISPLAKRIAEMNDVPLNKIVGSGPEGRIVKADVEKFIANVSNRTAEEAQTSENINQTASQATAYDSDQQLMHPAAPLTSRPGAAQPSLAQLNKTASNVSGSGETIPVSTKRRIIAQRLSESKFSAPHYYLTVSVSVDNLIQERKNLNDILNDKVSFNSFLMKYTAEALKKHPMVNAAWQGDTILKYKNADIALAVAQSDGLITPVVRDCGNKGVLDIDKELKVLIDKARNNALLPEDYQGATFTISNLGSYGIEQSKQPYIN